MLVGATHVVVVSVVVIAVFSVRGGFDVISVALGVVVHVVVCVCLVGGVCLVMVAAKCVCISVTVVSLPAQQVQFLLSLSSLRLVDLTVYTDLAVTSGSQVMGSLTEALVSELALHDWALISCLFRCALGAGGLLDGVLYMVIHPHGHPSGSTCDFEQSETIAQPALLVELLQ